MESLETTRPCQEEETKLVKAEIESGNARWLIIFLAILALSGSFYCYDMPG
jgi:hypothetical protein